MEPLDTIELDLFTDITERRGRRVETGLHYLEESQVSLLRSGVVAVPKLPRQFAKTPIILEHQESEQHL